jgi:small subunit ribosomal protein S6
VVYIFDSALEEPAVNERLARFNALLGEGTEVATSHWGKRTLAYPIKHRDAGYYVVSKFEAPGELLPEFERAIKLDESVVRFLVVLAEEYTVAARVPLEGAPVPAEEDDE